MYQLLCDSQITFDQAGGPVCSSGWIAAPHADLFPPLDLPEVWVLWSAIAGLWALAFAFRAVRKSIDTRL